MSSKKRKSSRVWNTLKGLGAFVAVIVLLLLPPSIGERLKAVSRAGLCPVEELLSGTGAQPSSARKRTVEGRDRTRHAAKRR